MAAILVIDDDDGTRELLMIALTQAGHHLVGASTGQEGLDISRKTHPDLVIIDIIMPDIDGLEVTRTLFNEFPTTKIIAITGAKEDKTHLLEAAKILGAHRVLGKPIQVADLLEAVNQELKK